MKRIFFAAFAFWSVALAVSVSAAQNDPKSIPPKKEKGAEPENIQIPGFLLSNDPKDKVRNNPCKIHVVKLTKGRSYVIDMVSPEFDTYLRLEDCKGKQLAADDDGGEGLNSRIHFQPAETGNFTIIATSFGAGTGMYTLSVKEGANGAGALVIPAPPAPILVQPNPGVKQDPPPEPKKIHETKKDLKIEDELTNNDRQDPTQKTSCKIFAVQMEKGKTYRIDMTSQAMDPYLRLVDSKGNTLAEDDDAGGYPNALIRIAAPESGVFHIYATRFGPRLGKFTLTVTPEAAGNNQPKVDAPPLPPGRPVPPRIIPRIEPQPLPPDIKEKK